MATKNISSSAQSSKRIFINLNHPRYGVDTWYIEGEDDALIASNQGYYPIELLAAAPHLLAACKAFVEAYKKSNLEKPDAALRMAERAISLAEGE